VDIQRLAPRVRFFYNHIRPYQHLNYCTPIEVWDNKPMATSKTHEALYFTALCGNVAGFLHKSFSDLLHCILMLVIVNRILQVELKIFRPSLEFMG